MIVNEKNMENKGQSDYPRKKKGKRKKKTEMMSEDERKSWLEANVIQRRVHGEQESGEIMEWHLYRGSSQPETHSPPTIQSRQLHPIFQILRLELQLLISVETPCAPSDHRNFCASLSSRFEN